MYFGAPQLGCTPTLLYFSFRSFRKHQRTRERSERARTSAERQKEKESFFPHPYPVELAVNKSLAVCILSPALEGLWSLWTGYSPVCFSNWKHFTNTNTLYHLLIHVLKTLSMFLGYLWNSKSICSVAIFVNACFYSTINTLFLAYSFMTLQMRRKLGQVSSCKDLYHPDLQ